MKQRIRMFVSGAFMAAALLVTSAVATLAQSESVIHSFAGNDGSDPQGGLTLDASGNLFGTTQNGGVSATCQGCGTVFELTPGPKGTWTETVIYAFGASDGIAPTGPLLLDRKGNLYGTTIVGGNSGGGSVFELSPGANGTWTEKILYNFTGGVDGGTPFGGGLAMSSTGHLYGMTDLGGQYGYGTVFELVPADNGTWTEKVLHSFKQSNDGGNPAGGTPTLDAAGNLYGVAASGGLYDYGVVFQLTPESTGTWTYRVIYSFHGGSDGNSPSCNLIFDRAGNLYGTATYAVFELTPKGNGNWVKKTLHTFGGGSDGSILLGGLVFDTLGNLYGTTNAGGYHRGTVFELSPTSNETWRENILHRFHPQGGDGIFPSFGALVIDSKSRLYGTTPQGGAFNQGVVFEVAP